MGVLIGPQGLYCRVSIGPQGLSYGVSIGPQELYYAGAHKSSRTNPMRYL